MKNYFNFNSKGNIAFDALLGIILSVIALISIFSVFNDAFLQTPTNLDIVNNNANSIKEFVNYYKDGPYNSYGSCNGMLKLSNLENFQFQEDDRNYFYVIDKNGVYILKLKHLDLFQEDRSLNGKIASSFCFSGDKTFSKSCDNNNNFNLFLDETDEGWIYSFEFTIGSIGRGNDFLELKKMHDNEYIVLIPKFKLESISNLFDNTNKYNIFIVRDTNTKKGFYENVALGNFLVYDKFKKALFVSAHDLTNIILRKNLCFLKDLSKQDYNSYIEKIIEFKNYNELDYLNNKVIFSMEIYPKNSYLTFIWDSRPKCILNKDSVLKEISCKSLRFKSSLDIPFESNDMEYEDFIKRVENYYKFQETYSGRFKIELLYKSSEDYLKNERLISFDLVFDKLDFNYKESSKQIKKSGRNNIQKLASTDITSSFNIDNLDSLKKYEDEGLLYNMENSLGYNKYFNGCNDELCNAVIVSNGKLYFYLQQLNAFYTFNDYLLRIDGNNENNENEFDLYYAGNVIGGLSNKKIVYEEILLNKVGEIGGNDIEAYLLKDIQFAFGDENSLLKFDVIIPKTKISFIMDLNGVDKK